MLPGSASTKCQITWTALAAASGLVPIGIALAVRSVPDGWPAALAALESDPVLWIILAVPFMLGTCAFVGGRERDRGQAQGQALEAQVKAKTAKLTEAAKVSSDAATDRANLLAGLNEGIATFDADGRLSPERSPAFNRLIPHASEAETVEQLLEPCGTETETTSIVRLLLWDNDGFESPFEATTAMLPQKWTVIVRGKPRHLAFHYRPIRSSAKQLLKVLIVVEDETELGEVRAQQDEAQARVTRLTAAVGDLEAYVGFVDEINDRLEVAERLRREPDAPRPELLASLHTMKGTLALFDYSDASALCRQIEHAYVSGDPTEALWRQLRTLWRRQSKDVHEALRLEGTRLVYVRPDRLEALREALGRDDADGARQLAVELRCHPVERVMARYKRHVAASAERAGKHVRFRLDPESSEVAYHEMQRVDGALVHLLDNVVDHAAMVGSSIVLTVGVHRREDGGLRVVVEDDGVGVDGQKLAARAVERGVRDEAWVEDADEQAKIELVFEPGLSSRISDEDVGGVGIGLAAARSCIRSFGGDLRVSSAAGSGARFELWMPGQDSVDVLRWAELPECCSVIPYRSPGGLFEAHLSKHREVIAGVVSFVHNAG